MTWQPLTILVPFLGVEIRDAADRVFFAPGRTPAKPVDVAVVSIRPSFHDRLRPLAATLESIADDDRIDEREDVVVLLSGFPAYLSFKKGESLRLYSTITHSTGITGRDPHGRLEVEWADAVPGRGSREYPHLDARPGQLMQLGRPHGISGGGLWRARGSPKDEIWSPTTSAKLIGVPVAFRAPNTEYAESVVAWPWARQVAAAL